MAPFYYLKKKLKNFQFNFAREFEFWQVIILSIGTYIFRGNDIAFLS